MGQRIILPTLLLALLRGVQSSPFELTEEYVSEISKGIEDLQKVAETNRFKDGDFDPSAFNESDALKGAE